MKGLIFCANTDESSILSIMMQQAGFSISMTREMEQNIEELLKQSYHFFLYVIPDSAVQNGQTASLGYIKQLINVVKGSMMVISPNIPEDTIVLLYDAGVDTVLIKPYSIRILQAKLRNYIRRNSGLPNHAIPVLSQGRLTLDPTRRLVLIEGQEPQHLTQLEFRLLFTLLTHAGQILPTETIVEYVWGYSGTSSRDLVRGLIQRLRAKIEPVPSQPIYIITEAGIGYYFRVHEQLEQTIK